MKTVGYFDGIDPELLTRIAANGFCTLPLANDFDNYGKLASHLEPGDVDLILGYLHKIVPPLRACDDKTSPDAFRGLRPVDLLYRARSYSIPVLIVVPGEYHKQAKKLLGEAAEFVKIVKPEDLEKKVKEILEF
ncbi:MAG: hypothetical protein JSW61_08545 [Candidatus Thorarchaeota archaeon]|nr:MAG: hypothetical protein JSW61_08545 [Candidatus Thorarchaeota archaeon]